MRLAEFRSPVNGYNLPMLTAATISAVDTYWSGFLGCTRGQLRSEQPVVLPHGPALADYRGIYLQSFGHAPVISIPAPLLHKLGSRLAAAAQRELTADTHWSTLLGASLNRVIGPAWIGYTDTSTLRSSRPQALTRVLTSEDTPALRALQHSCTLTEWEHGGSSLGEYPLVGAFEDGELVAVAGYAIWGERIAHLAVLTHPPHRGRGLGRAVGGCLSALALQRGLLPQYRTLTANMPSRGIAEALGFQPYATSLALRLTTGPA
jgi:GNAT superfamily N-acetyltransferase